MTLLALQFTRKRRLSTRQALLLGGFRRARRTFLILALISLLLTFDTANAFVQITTPSLVAQSHKQPTAAQSRLMDSRSHKRDTANHFLLLASTKNESPSDDSDDMVPESVKIPLALLFLSQFILFVGVGAVIPAIPLYGQEIGLSQAANGIVISAPAVALLIGAKFAGNYADVARKPAMLYGMAVIAVADIGTAVSVTLPQLMLARFGLGAGRCVAESGERGMLADLAAQVPSLRGRALAAQQAIVALGIAIGAPLGGVVIEEYGPRASFLCVSAGAVAALLIYTLLPETVEVDGTATEKDNVVQNDNSNNNKPIRVEEREFTFLLKDKRWRSVALCQSGASFGFAAKIASIPLLATAILPGGAAGTGVLLSAAGLSGLVGAPVGGFLTDQFGARLTAALSGLVSATGLLLIPVVLSSSILDLSDITVVVPLFNGIHMSGEAAAFAFLVVLWSLGATAQGPALTAYAQELAPKGSEATALAFPRAAGDGTYIVAPFLLGAVADSVMTGTGAECALAGSAILVGATILAFTGEE